MTLIDSHCHLDSSKFKEDLPEVIERARAAGVERFVAIGTGEGPPDLEGGLRLATRFDGFVATVGVHPHDASKATPETFERLRELAVHPKIVALGEIGLDYHYDFSPRDTQRDIFREQLRIAREVKLPVVIHTREAWEETLEFIREEPTGRTGVMHCFTGGVAEAREALDLGFHLSFGGVLTFPKSDEIRAAVRFVPVDRFLVETDAPYLAPVPHRGKRNEPAFLVETVREVARIRATSVDDIADQTSRNFQQIFPRAAGGYTQLNS